MLNMNPYNESIFLWNVNSQPSKNGFKFNWIDCGSTWTWKGKHRGNFLWFPVCLCIFTTSAGYNLLEEVKIILHMQLDIKN